ncbi:MAG: hypothetical protein ACJ77B_11600 [Chloroflexota bacterium]
MADPGIETRTGAAHATHDLLLVAAHAAGDTLGTATERSASLVATCPDCAALAADLVAIAAATHDLPAAARPRDFTLRPEDAARLRPMGWRRLAAAFGASRLELVRPLAAGLTTLGLAGILLAGLPAAHEPSPGAERAGAPVAAGSPAASADQQFIKLASEPPSDAATGGGTIRATADGPEGGSTARAVIVAASVTAVVAGVSLLALSVAAGRQGRS